MLNYLTIKSELDGGKYFVNITKDLFLDTNAISIVPPHQFILELKGDLVVDDTVVTAAKHYKENGYLISLDNYVCTPENKKRITPLIPHLDFVKINVSKNSKEQILENFGECTNKELHLIAEMVESRYEHDLCVAAGFEYFQGYFFQKPETSHSKSLQPNIKAVLEVIKLLEAEPETEEIINAFRAYPDLVINMLQFVNSASIGGRQSIGSIRQAVSYIGRKALKNWLLLFMYSDTKTNRYNEALLESSLFRARNMQLTAQAMESEELAEKAFLVGILSNLDALFDISMQKLLGETLFGDDIKTALLTKEGELGVLLEIAISAEKGEFHSLIPNIQKTIVDSDTFAQILARTIYWTAQQVSHMKAQ